MKKPERTKTTEYATKKIRLFLNDSDYVPALLLSYIYADIRLRTLLTDWVEPRKEKWKPLQEILDNLRFFELLKECKKLGLFRENEFNQLNALRKQRNKVAHESELWKRLTSAQSRRIKDICEDTIQFLKHTTNS